MTVGQGAAGEGWTCATCGTHAPTSADRCAVCGAGGPLSSTPAPSVPVAPIARAATAPVAGSASNDPGSAGALSPVGTSPPAPAFGAPPAAVAAGGGGGSRPATVVWVAVAVAVTLVAVGFVAWLVSRPDGSDDAQPTPSEASAGSPITSEPPVEAEDPAATVTTTTPPTVASTTMAPAAPMDPASITARASSTLPEVSSKGLTYGPENVLDQNLQTAWSQAGSDGDVAAIGSWLELAWPSTSTVESVTITNGYVKTDAAFTKNLRARSVRVTADTGEESVIELADTKVPQTIPVHFSSARSLRFTIESAWDAGSVYPDVAITEIALDARPG